MPKVSLKKRGKRIKIKKLFRSIYSLILFIFVINMSYLGVFFVATPNAGANEGNSGNSAYQYDLEGKSLGSPSYSDVSHGAIHGYGNGDSVPIRLTISGLTKGETYWVKVAHDHENNVGVIGYNHFTNLTSPDADNLLIQSAGGNDMVKKYKLTFTADETTVRLKWDAVLGDNAANYSNGGNLFIFIVKGIDGENTGGRNLPTLVSVNRDITVEKTDNFDEVSIGSQPKYYITVNNLGDVSEEIKIVDYLPDNVEKVSISSDYVAGVYDATDHSVTWDNVTIGAGEEFEFRILVKATVEGVADNQVEVTPLTAGLAVITATDTTLVNDTDNRNITVEKTDNYDEVSIGSQPRYYITVKNLGDVSEDIKVVDYLPDNVEKVAISNDYVAGVYDSTEHSVTWDNVTIDAGEELEFRILVKATTEGVAVNEVEVTPLTAGLAVVLATDSTTIIDPAKTGDICGDNIINNNEECDGTDMPDGYDNDNFYCANDCEVEATTPSCTLDDNYYDYIIDFGAARLLSNGDQIHETDLKDINDVLDGEYKIALQAHDAYYGREHYPQSQEKYYLKFYDKDDNYVTSSNATTDLADGVNYALFDGVVNSSLNLDDVEKVKAVHAAYPTVSEPNSVNAVCAGIKILSVEPDCGNNVIDAGEQCDGTTMPDEYDNDYFYCSDACKVKVDVPSCTLNEDNYEQVVYFDELLLGSSNENYATSLKDLDPVLVDDEYEITLEAFDAHYRRDTASYPQLHEKYQLVFYNDGEPVATSSPTTDLDDEVSYDWFSGVVDNDLYIDEADQVKAVHAAYKSTGPESVYAICAGINPVDEPTPPSSICTLDSEDYDHVIKFDDTLLLSNDDDDYMTEVKDLDLVDGEYEITLEAYDSYDGRESISQPLEHYYLEFYDEYDYVVAESNPGDDLEDNKETARFKDVVNYNLEINDATSLRGVHAAYPNDDPNSVYALCAGITLVDEPTPSVCSLDEDDFEYFIDFDAQRLVSDSAYDYRTDKEMIDIPSGRYEVTLQAEDGHEDRAEQDQDHEQYKLAFYNDGYRVAYSNPTSDLKDGVDYTRKTQMVNSHLYIPEVDSVRGVHDAYPSDEPNSLNALCAGLNPIDDVYFTYSELYCLEEGDEVEIEFENISIDFAGDVTFHWDFGDDATSTDEHPTHSYTEAGSYEVVLTVTHDDGVDSFTRIIVIEDCDDIEYEWLTGDWGACSATCGGGVQYRTVVCVHSNDNTKVVDDEYCDDIDEPVDVQACNTQSCGSTGGGGGGGGTPGGGTPGAFAITNTQVTSQCINGNVIANVTWLTNYNANSRVVYGTTSQAGGNLGVAPNYGYAYSTVTYPTSVTGHSVSIEGLTPNTFYYFRGVSDYNTAEVIGEERFIQTPPCTVVEGEEGEPVLGLQTDFLINTYVNPGTRGVNYELIVENTGNLTSFNTVLTSTLPTYLTFSDTGSSVKTWNLGDLEPGKTSVIMAKVDVSTLAPTGSLIASAKVYSTNHGDVHSQTSLDVRRVTVLAGTGFSTTQFVALTGVLSLMIGASYLLRRKMRKMKLAHNIK